MKYFEYKVRDNKGKIKRDIITSDSRDSAMQMLRDRGVVILEISEMQDFLGIRRMLHNVHTKIGIEDLAEFFEQMAFMLDTDIKLYNALTVLRDFSASRKLSVLSSMLANEIRQGRGLYEAAEKHKDIFEEYMLQQIRSGEESGDMVSAMRNLAKQLRRTIGFKKKVKSALVMPIFTIIVMIVVVALMMLLVIPTLANTLTSMGTQLPAITVMVINASEFMKSYWWTIVGIIAAIVVAWIWVNKIPHIKYTIDKYKLKLPLFGALIQKMDIARFCSCMASMLSCGVSLVKALSIAKTTIKNDYMGKEMNKCEENIRLNGWSLPYAMRQSDAFPELLIQLVEIGVTSSKIPEVMTKLTVQYEEEAEDSLEKMTAMIQPMLIIVLGVVVGVIVISMFLPMMSVLDNIG